MKTKKDTEKLCELHKSHTHNTNVSRAKQSPVLKLKALESNACFDYEPEPNKGNDKGKQIIYIEQSATITTTKI